MTQTAFVSTAIPYVNSNPHIGHAEDLRDIEHYAKHQEFRRLEVWFERENTQKIYQA